MPDLAAILADPEQLVTIVMLALAQGWAVGFAALALSLVYRR